MRRKTSASWLVVLLALSTAPAEAQQAGTVMGTVLDVATREPLSGVQVHVPGSDAGRVTDADGRFLLPGLPAGEVRIEARRIGHTAVTRTIVLAAGATERVDFELARTAIALDQIVVTGAGAPTERRRLGNVVASIDARQLETAPAVSFSELLQGREPGVVGLPSGGLPGEGTRIRIRGSASLSQANEPIVYVDGVRVDNAGGLGRGIGAGGGGTPSRLDDINPAAIERIEILKGAAAATLYGTEASSGVIQIFTRDGREGGARWELRVDQGASRFPDRYLRHERKYGFVQGPEPMLRATTDLLDLGTESVRSYWGLDVEPYEVFGVDILEPFGLVETGRHSTYSVSVSGGTPTVTYFGAARFFAEDGPMGQGRFLRDGDGELLGAPQAPWGDARDFTRNVQANANVGFFPSENVRLRLSSMYTTRYHEVPENNNNTFGVHSKAANSRPEFAHPGNATGSLAFSTVRETLQRLTFQEVDRFAGTLNAGYTPVKSIGLEATVGVDVVAQRGVKFLPFGWTVDDFSQTQPDGYRRVSNRAHRELTFGSRGTWTEELGERLASSFSVGVQAFTAQTHHTVLTGQVFPGRGLEVAGAAEQQTVDEAFLTEVSAGVYAQEQIAYRDFVFLTLGARYDRHSAFGETAGGALYPKVSLSAVPSDRPGWTPGPVSTLRFRAALGQSGLQPGAFDKYTTYAPTASQRGAGIVPSNLGNPDLRPEVATETELGADIGLWDDRAALELTIWNRNVTDALVARQFPPTGGFSGLQLDNIGAIHARGLEASVTGLVFSRRSSSLELFANAAYLRERVTSLGGAPPLKVGGTYPRYRNFIREGYAPGAFFGPRTMDVDYPISLTGDCAPAGRDALLAFFAQPRTPDEIDVLVEDCGGDFLGHYLGKPTPDWQGSFGGSFRFLSDLELSALFEFRAGNYHVHGLSDAFHRSNSRVGRNTRESAQAEATLLNPASSPEERLDAALGWARELKALSPYDGLNEIHPADFIRLREVGLHYRAPAALATRVGARTLGFGVAARNLALWTRWPGSDPEANQIGRSEGDGLTASFLDGVNAWSLPLPQRVTFSARVGF